VKAERKEGVSSVKAKIQILTYFINYQYLI